MRGGVCILIASLAVLAGAGAACADPAGVTTTTALTTTTDAQATTTAPATTAAATTAAPAPLRYATAVATPLGSSCSSAGAAAIVMPGDQPVAVGAAPATLGAAAYRSVVSFDGADVTGTRCSPGAVTVRSLSLFGGAVTADSIVSHDGMGTIAGMRVVGYVVSLPPGSSVAIGNWAEVETGARTGALSAPLAIHLLRPHAGLPAGTTVLVGWAGRAAKPAPATAAATTATPKPQTRPAMPHARHHGRQRHLRRPLKVTPPLGETGYIFPIAGGAQFSDTYGAHRGDISDGWHHGDDLFAPLGTPVVAVADGTLSLIGWEQLGGWRLWLTDAKGNQYYYAHLSGYSPKALRNHHVRAGEILGFLGRTGDAFTTTPHLHFEVHPVSLLRLGYDGAVDPTRYLNGWRVVHPRRAPTPRLPGPAPSGLPRLESRIVWRELLAARGLLAPPRLALIVRHPYPRDDIAPRAAPHLTAPPAPIAVPAAPAGPPPYVLALGIGLGAAGLSAFTTLLLRRRRRPPRPVLLPTLTREDNGYYRLRQPS
ncbi:MAG: M23 family metallopeptidase [Actinobacteria bacterium]|nr:M23 family metallopeptidase [Actinomycetota bacterium]